MPRNFTMDALVEACSDQVDLTNHTVISRAAWQALISRAYGELWTAVHKAYSRYFETTETFTTDGTAYLTEPTNHLAFVSLSYVSGTERTDLRLVQPQDRARVSRMTATAQDRAQFYERVDDRIYLYPTPPSGQTYELRYVPQSPDLTTYDGDTCVDVVTPSGHDFLIWSVAVRACGKTEADPLLAIRERDSWKREFSEDVGELNKYAPTQIKVEEDEDGVIDW